MLSQIWLWHHNSDVLYPKHETPWGASAPLYSLNSKRRKFARSHAGCNAIERWRKIRSGRWFLGKRNCGGNIHDILLKKSPDTKEEIRETVVWKKRAKCSSWHLVLPVHVQYSAINLIFYMYTHLQGKAQKYCSLATRLTVKNKINYK
jgi:hypothetical protein